MDDLSPTPAPTKARIGARSRKRPLQPSFVRVAIVTGTRRSNLVLRPVLRICASGFAANHVIVHAIDSPPCRLRKPPRYKRVDKASRASSDERCADHDCSRSMLGPAHSERARVLEK
jgi:hypothetical protein